MRLAVIFLWVLGLSVVASSFAVWAMMFSTSHVRIRSMAVDFTMMADATLQNFEAMVGGLIGDSNVTMTNITAAEFTASVQALDAIQAQLQTTTAGLLADANSSTAGAQNDTANLVASFGRFMDTVITNFEYVAVAYASQLRLELAGKAQAAFTNMIQERVVAMQWSATLVAGGALNISLPPGVGVMAPRCLWLSVLCGGSAALRNGGALFVANAYGELYTCDAAEGMSVLGPVDGVQTLYEWERYPSNTSTTDRKSWQQRCLTEPPVVKDYGPDCQAPGTCNGTCAFDPRCQEWYTCFGTAADPMAMHFTEVYPDLLTGQPVVTLSVPIVDPNTSDLLGVSGVDFRIADMNAVIESLPLPNSTRIAFILADANLTVLGSSANFLQCSTGGMSPPFALADSCDLQVQQLAAWMHVTNITAVHSQSTGDAIWDVFPTVSNLISYYVVVGMDPTAVFGVIDTMQLWATQQLSALSKAQATKVAASGAASQQRMQAAQARSLQQLLEIRTSSADRLAALQDVAWGTLTSSQANSAARVEGLMAQQSAQIDDLLSTQLQGLTISAGWTVAVVFGIFVAILACGAYGTVRVTRRLCEMIGLMEEAAEMQVESLEVPQDSGVLEVRRIQIAFQSLIKRLTEYKSFMPAALFPPVDVDCPMSPLPSGPRAASVCGLLSTPEGIPHTESVGLKKLRRLMTISSRLPSTKLDLSPSAVINVSPTRAQLAKKASVAMVINVIGFKNHLFNVPEGHLEQLLSQYVAIAHATVSKARGYIDSVVGDQILVTFNAHVLCSDPPCSAATAALELRQEFLSKLSGRLHTQIGLAAGHLITGAAGYGPFKALVSLGTPMKLASILAHLTHHQDGAVLVDGGMEERIRYSFTVRPSEVISLPVLGALQPSLARNVRVYLVEGPKTLEEDEWLYQVAQTPAADDWDTTIQRMVSAEDREAAVVLLQQHLTAHPEDGIAQRLRDRMGRWVPRRGIPVCEGPDQPPLPTPPPTGAPDSSTAADRLARLRKSIGDDAFRTPSTPTSSGFPHPPGSFSSTLLVMPTGLLPLHPAARAARIVG